MAACGPVRAPAAPGAPLRATMGRSVSSGEPGAVLVHGAWTGAWVWLPVRLWLRRLGVPHVAVRLPSQSQVVASLADDVAAVRGGVDALGRPAVVVGYSYGGVPVTELAAVDMRVVGLVYISGAMVDVGESTLDLISGDPDPSLWNRILCRTRVGRRLMDVAKLRARLAMRRDVRSETFVLAASPSSAGWRRVPSAFVVLRRDLIFSAELQRRLAARATRRYEVRGFHVAVVTHPVQIARIIAAEVARARSATGG